MAKHRGDRHRPPDLRQGDAVEAIETYGAGACRVHFKDCDPALVGRVRGEAWDYGCDAAFGRQNDVGGIVVEQDVLPGPDTPAESARRNRVYLEQLGL